MKPLHMKTIGLVGLVSVLTLGGCTDETVAYEAAKNAGWTEISIKEGRFADYFACTSDLDEVPYLLEGKNPAGKPAQALVCCGAFVKACTIRY